ncbi:hypothetical protein WICMUC_003001 [Wickerhamomyces mucosus]|uniref:Lysophospholipase n=1 Tax=Wickerhamomyces mucosus TaxID=1378264 RepID=A0A9P8PMF1_9ASCO|nr:hypothetical protein WICMUC_003001 [Wickerhamomyces mucosus]
MKSYLKRVKIPGFNIDEFFLSSLKPINIGIGISGGGYRAFLNGAGLLAAFDDRSFNSTQPGHLGGILQSSNYIAGISGGSWILMSLILSDYQPIFQLRHEWELSEPLLEGIPSFKQMEVSASDVQVLPAEIGRSDEDFSFYNRLNKNVKRSVTDEGNEEYSFDVIFEDFYQNMESLNDLSKIYDDGTSAYEIQVGECFEFVSDGSDGSNEKSNLNLGDSNVVNLKRSLEISEILQLVSEKQVSQGSKAFMEREKITHPSLWKREDRTQDWYGKFKVFLTELFKTKRKAEQRQQDMLANIELLKDQASLKYLKKVFNFYKNLHLEVRSKKLGGFPVSFTDYWGRALSRRVFPKNSRSPNKTFSEVRSLESFKDYRQPFPIILSNLRNPGVKKTSITSNIFEFTPYEFGSFDFKMFCDLQYLGSALSNGHPSFQRSNKSICFRNFDNTGFITGTSSSLFNNVLIYVWKLAAASTKGNYRAIKAVLNTFGLSSSAMSNENPQRHPDYALYTPNPFFRFGSPTNEIYNATNLYMVDGGEDGQNIPFHPLLQKNRKVDLIFALDSTADSKGWPNGTVLKSTQMRYDDLAHEGTLVSFDGETKLINRFPKIPSSEEFSERGLNTRPVFFGCYLDLYSQRNMSYKYDRAETDQYLPPIIGYFANTYVSYSSNTSTFKLTYENDEINSMIENSYNVVSYSNSTIDKNYSKCVGCIMIKREFDRKVRGLSAFKDIEIPKFCTKCYEKYCYN